MTKTATDPTPEPKPDASPAETTPPQLWIWRALITGIALTGAANYLIYSRGPGAGWAVFFLLLALGIFLNRQSKGFLRLAEVFAATLLTVSAVQMVVRPSLSNAIILFTLTLLASAHFLQLGKTPTAPGRKVIEALRKLALAPFRWIQASHQIFREQGDNISNITRKIPGPKQLSRAIQILAPATIIILPFFILLSIGNGVLGQFVTNAIEDFLVSLTDVSPPSPGRMLFIVAIGTALLGLLWRTEPSKIIDTMLTGLGKTASIPKDHFVARWRSILILIGVNVLFFAANSIDLTYLKTNHLQLPAGVSYSEFVHQGTNTLIGSAVIAAIVLGLLFQQDKSVTNSRAIRGLALLWIAQNLLLIANVARRVSIYISDYHLSVLRVHLILFLVLVCVGFVLLAIRIVRDQSFGWLVSANLAAVFLLFATLQFWDSRRFVAEYNFERAIEEPGKRLDTAYLAGLGPSAWDVLARAVNADLTAREQKDAANALAEIAQEEIEKSEKTDWRDYTWFKTHALKALVTNGFLDEQALAQQQAKNEQNTRTTRAFSSRTSRR